MEEVRKRAPDMPIISGGSLVTSVPHVFLDYTDTDVAVISEGEITILELMAAYARGEWSRTDKRGLQEIRGIWYRSEEGRQVANPPRGQLMDLNCLPKMRLDLWPQYHSPMGLQPQIISSYSRGCKMAVSYTHLTLPTKRIV